MRNVIAGTAKKSMADELLALIPQRSTVNLLKATGYGKDGLPRRARRPRRGAENFESADFIRMELLQVPPRGRCDACVTVPNHAHAQFIPTVHRSALQDPVPLRDLGTAGVVKEHENPGGQQRNMPPWKRLKERVNRVMPYPKRDDERLFLNTTCPDLVGMLSFVGGSVC